MRKQSYGHGAAPIRNLERTERPSLHCLRRRTIYTTIEEAVSRRLPETHGARGDRFLGMKPIQMHLQRLSSVELKELYNIDFDASEATSLLKPPMIG